MNVFITGGTGLVGKALIDALIRRGNRVTVLSRNIYGAKQKLGNEVDLCQSLDKLNSLDGFDAVINLAGEPIADKRWTVRQKQNLCNSRWDITRRLTELIKMSEVPPKVFISGSAVGYYGIQDDKILDETSKPREDFLSQLCSKWESLAMAASSKYTRVCILRTGIVLSPKGGMLSKMTLPFKLGLGCVLGKGSQYISWIHLEDMVNGIILLLNKSEAKGVYNFTAPNPVTNKRFSKVLSSTLFRPCIFHIPGWLIKAALGESATMLLDGQRVIPNRLYGLNYRFLFEHIDAALHDLLRRKELIDNIEIAEDEY